MEWLLFLSVLLQQLSAVAGLTEIIFQDTHRTFFDIIADVDQGTPSYSLLADLLLKWTSVLVSVASSITIMFVFHHVKGHRKVESSRFLGTPLIYIALPHCALLAQAARIILRLTTVVETHAQPLGFQHYCIGCAFIFTLLSELSYIGLVVKIYHQQDRRSIQNSKHQLYKAYSLVKEDSLCVLSDEKLLIA